MAFLDNSGDIILDAVLTDLGRKRLAEGNFRITQFALGDDEVDYGLYDKDHPSGSAYYDLEILQTPVFEAFTQTNANINYGLISLNGITDILYMPSMLLNQKTALITNNVALKDGISYLAANQVDVIDLTTYLTGTQYVMEPNSTNKRFMFETGLNSSDGVPDRTQANRQTYLVSNGLVDGQFKVSFDSRFLSSIYPINNESSFLYPDGGTPSVNILLSATGSTTTNASLGLKDYRTSTISGIDNAVYKQSGGTLTDADLDYSEINGPRASVTAFSLNINPDMQSTSATAPAKYTLYGETSQNLFGNGVLYDYVDTTIYIMGATTGVTAQLPVRIIRKVGT
jgi:hypothetical protein